MSIQFLNTSTTKLPSFLTKKTSSNSTPIPEKTDKLDKPPSPSPQIKTFAEIVSTTILKPQFNINVDLNLDFKPDTLNSRKYPLTIAVYDTIIEIGNRGMSTTLDSIQDSDRILCEKFKLNFKKKYSKWIALAKDIILFTKKFELLHQDNDYLKLKYIYAMTILNILISVIMINKDLSATIEKFFLALSNNYENLEPIVREISELEITHEKYLFDRDNSKNKKICAEKNIYFLKKDKEKKTDAEERSIIMENISEQERVIKTSVEDIKILDDKIKRVILDIDAQKDKFGSITQNIFQMITFNYFTSADYFSALDYKLFDTGVVRIESTYKFFVRYGHE